MIVDLSTLSPAQVTPITPAPAPAPSQPIAPPQATVPEGPAAGAPGDPALDLEAALDIRIRLTIGGEGHHSREKAIKKAVKRFGKLLRHELEQEAKRLGLDEDGRKALKSLGKKIAKTLEKAVKEAFRGERGHEAENDHDADDAAPVLAQALQRASDALAEAAARLAGPAPAGDAGDTVAPGTSAPATDVPAAAPAAGAPVAETPVAEAPADAATGSPSAAEPPAPSPAEPAPVTAAPEADPFARLTDLLGRFLDQLRDLLAQAAQPAAAPEGETGGLPAASGSEDGGEARPAFARIDVAVAFYAHVSVTTGSEPAGSVDQAV